MVIPIENMEMCITSFCNLNCLHCYQKFDKNKFLLSYDEINSVISNRQFEYKKIIFSGGEFFSHNDAYKILQIAVGYANRVVVVTNATIINIQEIIKLKRKIVFIVSIDGLKEYHDMRRGEGNFQRTMQNIDSLKREGFEVTANVTLDGNNIYTIKQLIELLNSHVNKIKLLPIAFAGFACQNSRQLRIENKKFNAIVPKIYKKLTRKFQGCISEETGRCNIFPRSFSINFDGFVYPCGMARDLDYLKMGNIHKSAIEEIYFNFFKTNTGELLNNYKNSSSLRICSECEVINTCYTGCRIRALKANNDIFSPDPFACRIYKDNYPKVEISKLFWGETN